MTTLLVASGGGHLKQLHRLLPRFGFDDDRLWITFDTGLSRSLLQGENVCFAPYAHPHDVLGTLRDTTFALRILREHRVDRAISTGANLAVATLPLVRARGARAVYIETATRTHGPSLTGRLLQAFPGIERYTQHPAWADNRWHYGGSVLDGFVPLALSRPPAVQKLVITLGSNESFGFRRLLERLVAVVPPEIDVLWQVGVTPFADLPIDGRPIVPATELEAAMAEAQAVVAHAGTGSALSALEAGHLPVLVPRRSARKEHVDDHQIFTAGALAARGLATAVEVDELCWDDIVASARWRVGQLPNPPPFIWR